MGITEEGFIKLLILGRRIVQRLVSPREPVARIIDRVSPANRFPPLRLRDAASGELPGVLPNLTHSK